VMLLSLNSETLPLSEVDEYAEVMLAQRISTVDGVAQVQVMGAQKYAVRVKLDPRELTSRGIGIDEVRTALNTNNVNLPAGTIDGANKSVTLMATGQLKSADGFRKVIVTYRNGAPVRLGDLGEVVDSVQNDKSAGWLGKGKEGTVTRSIMLMVQRQPGTNTIKVVDGIKELLPTFRAQLPASVNLDVLIDRSLAIRESVHDVKFTLVLAICLVVLVIFMFLRSLSATRWQIFRKARFPSALPYVFAGLDMAAAFSVVGAIVGEFVGAQSGLGVLILQLDAQMDTGGSFSVLVVLSLMGITLNALLRAVRRRVLHWMPAEGESRTLST